MIEFKFSGTINQIQEQFNSWVLATKKTMTSEEVYTKKITCHIFELKSLDQNNLIHKALRLLGEEMGLETDAEIKQLKDDLKVSLGLVDENGQLISMSNFDKKMSNDFFQHICRLASENFGMNIESMVKKNINK